MRKFRYTFEGMNENGEVVFDQCFVKLSDKLSWPVMIPRDYSHGGAFFITQFFTMFDQPGEAITEFRKYTDCFENVVSGRLKQFDGCGRLLEQCDLWGVRMTLSSRSLINSDDDIIAEWIVKYSNCDWHVIENAKLA